MNSQGSLSLTPLKLCLTIALLTGIILNGSELLEAGGRRESTVAQERDAET